MIMTKKFLTERCRELLYNNIDKELSKDDIKWLWEEVYKYHPNRDYSYDDIMKVTPKHNWSYGNKNYGFFVETKDGNGDFWSFPKSIANRPKDTLK